MRLDYNEFLRIMTCVLIILLIVQGLDYIFGFGVNNYLFIFFCIAFAFTVGSIYHNVLTVEGKGEVDKAEPIVQRNNGESEIDVLVKEMKLEFNDEDIA